MKHALHSLALVGTLALGLSLTAGCSSPQASTATEPAATAPKAAAPPEAAPPAAESSGTSSQGSAAASPASGDEPPAAGRKTYDKAPPVGNLDEYKKLQAVIETTRGNIIFTFFPTDAPRTVASFVKLSRDRFYDGLTFHRVEPGFVIQGGDPNGDGSGGPGYQLPAEFNDHKHLAGTVAMARTSDPNSAGSQFYICLDAIPSLDNQYTVFGQVTKGFETVKKIEKGDKILRIRIVPRTP